jgi:hypothetical protein
MALSNVELYEALKGPVGPEAARLIAEVVPPAEGLATKADLLATKSDLQQGLANVQEGLANVRAEMHALNASTIRWMLMFFIPVWAGTWATFLAILLKH